MEFVLETIMFIPFLEEVDVVNVELGLEALHCQVEQAVVRVRLTVVEKVCLILYKDEQV